MVAVNKLFRYDVKLTFKRVGEIESNTITKPESVLEYMKGSFDNFPLQESFWVLLIDSKNNIMGKHMCTLGLVNETLVHPRECFRSSVVQGSSGVIFAHNHPSGFLEPSQNDIKATEGLVKAGEILDIPVLDHIIMNNECSDYLSLRMYESTKNLFSA